jgi:uncharacterized protein (TIGR03437 family)
MIYSAAKQIAGVLPSNVPVGTGTLTVNFNGRSGTTPIQVVGSNFGISTVNQTGGGPAVVTFPNYNLVTTTSPAKPGDTLLLWGTGLGPITGGDAGIPNQVDLGTPVTVYVGGVAATVTYRGRSAAPGLDQINFVVPSGVSGCFVTLMVQTGNTVSNNPTMAISPNGGPCSDPNGISLSAFPGAIAKGGVLSVGSVSLTQTSLAIQIAGQSISNTSVGGSAAFERFTAAQLATSPSFFGIPSVGSCTVYTFVGTTPPSIASALGIGLDAGTAIAVTPPSGTPANLLTTGVTGSYSGTLQSLPAGSYAINNGKGGADVGAFSTSLNVPQPLTWTNQAAITVPTPGFVGTVNRTAPLRITWSGGDPNGFAEIAGFSISGTTTTSLGGFFLCIAPIAPGQFSVPVPVLLSLPPTPTNGVGILLVGSSSAPQPFTAPGLDVGVAASGSLAGSSVLYQ